MSDRKNHPIIVNTNCYHGYSVEDSLRGIAAAGFRYVELTATEGWTEHVFRNNTFEKLCRVRDLMEELGLVALSMSGHTNLMDDSRVQDFIDNISLAHFFGCKTIVSSIGEAHLTDKSIASNQVVADHIKTFLPTLEKYDMNLVLEIHGDHARGDILKEICDLTGSDRVKINYDTANAVFWGLMTPEQMVEDVEKNVADIAYIHIKDHKGATKDWDFPALGEGELPLDSVFEILDRAGNDCPLSIEIEFTAEGSGCLENVNTAVKKSGEYLISRGFSLK